MMKTLHLTAGTRAEALDCGNEFTTGSELFRWPVITTEMRANVLAVLDAGTMSGTDVTRKFERAYADWIGVPLALGHNTGTAALAGAMVGAGLGPGDELIAPTATFWASCTQALALGAKVVFADIDPETLCIDPADIEHRITPRTRAIMAVHHLGYPADMDRINALARKHKIKVIEDVSHAQGSRYKGRPAGALADVAAMSLMSAKSFAIGEAGILLTSDRAIYERVILWGHAERHGELTDPALIARSGIPNGGWKCRMHQLSSAVGLAELPLYPAQIAEIDRAMNYFYDRLEGVPGIRAHRPPQGSGSTMGGWYCPHALYRPEELEGLSVTTFCKALNAEGVAIATPGLTDLLHRHPLFAGYPANSGPYPAAEMIQRRTMYIPWFKRFRPETIDRYVAAYRKVAEHYRELLALDAGDDPQLGRWMLSPQKK